MGNVKDADQAKRRIRYEAALLAALTIMVVGLVMTAGESQAGPLICSTFTSGASCYSAGSNDCSTNYCYTGVTAGATCDNGDLIQSMKVTNMTVIWSRCRNFTGSGKSCSETATECGTTVTYSEAPVETGYCQDQDICTSKWVRTACKASGSSCF